MKIFKQAVTLFLTFTLLVFCSCKNKQEQIPVQNAIAVEITNSNHAWYYFSNTNYHLVDRPQNTPAQSAKPWTESIRISSANNEFCTQNSDSKAFAVVNRLGILSFNDDIISLSQDTSLFTDRTAGNLVFLNNVPVFSVYKSAFFNDTILAPNYKNDSSAHLFLFSLTQRQKFLTPS